MCVKLCEVEVCAAIRHKAAARIRTPFASRLGGELWVPSGRREKSESPALDHCSPSCLKNGLVLGFPA